MCVPEQLWPPVPVLLQSRVLFLGRGRRFVLLTRQRAGADRRARCAQVQTGHSQLSNGGNLARLRRQQQRVVKHGHTSQQRGMRRAFLQSARFPQIRSRTFPFLDQCTPRDSHNAEAE